MDLNSLKNQVTIAKVAQNTTRNVQLLNIDDLKIGNQIQGTVENIYKLTPKQLETLLNLFKFPKNQILNNDDITSNIPTIINQLKSNKSENTTTTKLFLAELNISNKKLHLLTDIPESLPKQPKLLIGPNREIILANSKAPHSEGKLSIDYKSNTENANPTTVKTDTIIKEADKKLTSELGVERVRPQSQNMPLEQAIKIIQEGIKKHLPHQQSIVHVIKKLELISKELTAFPRKTNTSETNPKTDLIQLLRKINTNLPSTDTLKNIDVFQKILKESGFQLENTILKQVSNQSNSTQKSSTTIGDKPEFSTPITKKDIFSSSLSPKDTTRSIQPNLDVDTKAMLLKLHTAIEQVLRDFSANSSKNNQIFDKLTNIILTALNRNTTFLETKTSESQRTTALLKLKELVNSGISRISNLQLNHLMSISQDAQLAPTGGSFEIPVRLGDSLFPLFINIHEYHEKEKEYANEEAVANAEVKKKWNVYLELEIDELGYFASELIYTQGKLKTRFWIENNELEASAKSNIDQLFDKLNTLGVEIEEVTFSKSIPPRKISSVVQSLIDIET